MKNKIDFSKGKRGAVVTPAGKTRITIYLDDDLLDLFREKAGQLGIGYQTLINQALRKAAGTQTVEPLTIEMLRLVLREELHAV